MREEVLKACQSIIAQTFSQNLIAIDILASNNSVTDIHQQAITHIQNLEEAARQEVQRLIDLGTHMEAISHITYLEPSLSQSGYWKTFTLFLALHCVRELRKTLARRRPKEIEGNTRFRPVEPRAYPSILGTLFTSDLFRVSNRHSPKEKYGGILARLSADHTFSMAYCFHHHMHIHMHIHMHLSLYLEMANENLFLHLLSSASKGV